MSYYDKKQEVIDIQLTQYGKIALSQGRFRPHSYGFFDDDIIYDVSYIGFSEEQNSSQDRILTFARKKPALSIYGSETKINETSLSGAQKDGIKQMNANDVDSRMLLRNELLTYPVSSQLIPKFTIATTANAAQFVEGSLTKTSNGYMSTSTDLVKMKFKAVELQETVTAPPVLITFYEELEFCKDEEYNIRLYEIETQPSSQDESKTIEKIANLYYNSSDAQHPRVSTRFVISTDDNIENQSAILESRKDCSNSLKFSTKTQAPSQTVMRDLYEGLDSVRHDCEE